MVGLITDDTEESRLQKMTTTKTPLRLVIQLSHFAHITPA